MGYIVDLSEWQQDVDFAKLSKVVDFVILRVQAGSSHADQRYQEYVSGCKANGILYGTYAYAKFVSVSDSLQEAKDAYSRMDKDSLFFVLDVESVCVKNPADLVPASQAFIDYMKNQGIQKVGLYSGEYFYNQHGLSNLSYSFLWLAKYSGSDNGQINLALRPSTYADLWQYSEKGKLDGVPTLVDLNVINGSKGLDYFTGKQVLVQAKTDSVPPSSASAPVAPVRNPIMVVKVLCDTDVRSQPSHTAGFVRTAKVGEILNVWSVNNDWHEVVGGYIDGAKGHNLYWVDNPALKPKATPQPVMYKVVAGDYASKITSKFGCSLADLKVWNNLDSNYTLYAGQTIRVK